MTDRSTLRGALTVLLTLLVWSQSGCRAQTPWPQWQQYSQHFIDQQGRVIDHTAQDRTTSEGQAYALFFALVANDKPGFGKILGWTEANLAGGDLTVRLPAWTWGRNPDGSWRVIDTNPASDADVWMAYTLLEAGRLWQDPRYEKLGTVMASRIAQEEIASVPGIGTTLLPGPQGFHPDAKTWILNPSYLPLPLITGLARRMPQGPWTQLAGSLHLMLSQSSSAGYAMDWISAGDGVHASLSPAQLAAGKTDGPPPVGSYDAIRVYLWLGIADPATPGLKQLLADTSGMARYLHTNVTPPLQVGPNGKILSAAAPVGFSAAVIPYLHAVHLGPEEKTQADRLVALRDPTTGLYGKDAAYYDQNLALFANGWSEQRFRFDRDGTLKVQWK
jgi:endo-1,4-beta-D-glucanase Y